MLLALVLVALDLRVIVELPAKFGPASYELVPAALLTSLLK